MVFAMLLAVIVSICCMKNVLKEQLNCYIDMLNISAADAGVIGEWGEWDCNVSCGDGIQTRTRSCSSMLNANNCPLDCSQVQTTETGNCQLDPCCPGMSQRLAPYLIIFQSVFTYLCKVCASTKQPYKFCNSR